MSRVIFLLLLLVFAVEVYAQETLPGDVCTTAGIFRQSGGPEVATGGHFLVCDGANWKSILDFKRTGELSSIGNQVCASGEILVFDGTKWACGTAGGGGGGSFQFNDTAVRAAVRGHNSYCVPLVRCPVIIPVVLSLPAV